MRALRLLAQDVWYEVHTAVNNREPLFWDERERARFEQVLNEAGVVSPAIRDYAHRCGFYVLELGGESVRLADTPAGFVAKVW
jgi:hypothetical protein